MPDDIREPTGRHLLAEPEPIRQRPGVAQYAIPIVVALLGGSGVELVARRVDTPAMPPEIVERIRSVEGRTKALEDDAHRVEVERARRDEKLDAKLAGLGEKMDELKAEVQRLGRHR